MFGYMTTASVSTIVHTVSRCICARSWAIGTASTVWARSSSNRLRANASAPAGVVRSPTPTATTPGCQQQHVAALDRRGPRLVGPPHAEKPRVVGIDQVGQRRLADPGGQRQRRDRHPRADPERRVAGEQQVRQRFDDEVAAVVHATHQRHLAAGDRQLGERHARHQDMRQHPRVPASADTTKAPAPAAVPAVANPPPPRCRACGPRRWTAPRSADPTAAAPRRRATATGRRTRRVPPAPCATQGSPSNSNASLLRGVSRCSSAPGRCRMTTRSAPDLGVHPQRGRRTHLAP